jgi:outer membrane receptor protein involved in Fe transport
MLLFVLAQAAAAFVAPDQGAGVVSYPPAFFAAQNPNSALEMVGRLPGFNLDTGDTVRGFEGAAGNVLIDGQRPASKTDTLDVILSRIPADKVERVDLIRGGAPGIDMQGKTMIANVVLKKGGGIRGLLSIADYHVMDGRDFGGLRAEASGALPGDRTWEVALHAGAGPDDGVGTGHSTLVHADGSPTQVATLFSQGRDEQASLTGAFDTPLFGGRLKVNGLVDTDTFKEPETDTITAPAPDIQTFGYRQETKDTELGGRFTRNFGPNTSIELVGLRTTRDRTVDSASDVEGSFTDFLSDQQSTETIARGVFKRRFGKQFSIEAGAETADNTLDSRSREAIDGVNQELPAAKVMVEEKRTEVFLKGAWQPSPKWTVDAALRYETSDISSSGDVVLAKTLQFAKPRLTVAWTPVQATQLRMRVEHTVGQLNFNDFVASSNLTNGAGVSAGNPNLNPQQAWVFEAAVEQQLWKGASVVLTARHSNLTDVVDRGPVFASDGTVFDTPANIGAGTEDDAILDVTLPFDQLGWKGLLIKGEYLQRWSEVTDPTTGQKRQISNLHPDDWNVTISQDLPDRHLNLGVDIYNNWSQTAYRFNQIEILKISQFVRPFVEWKPGHGISLRMELPLVNAPQTRLRDTLEFFPGPRSSPGVPDLQNRIFHFPRGFYLRLRKDFG